MSEYPLTLRSRAGRLLQQHSVRGELILQQCRCCDTVQYPPREVCGNCLADELPWQGQASGGTLLAGSALHHSLEPWFRSQLPFLLCSVKLDCGPVVLAQLCENDWVLGQRVDVTASIEEGGNVILRAQSEKVEAS